MFWGALIISLATFFIITYNIITVIAIVRKRIAPSYFKVKFSFILNSIWCLGLGYVALDTKIDDYGFAWLLIYLCLMIWYAFILKDKDPASKNPN